MKNVFIIIGVIVLMIGCKNYSSSNNSEKNNLPKEPKSIKVFWSKDGGMLPEYERIYLSNDSCSYLSSKNKINQLVLFSLTPDELKIVYDVFYENKFNQIQTFEEQIYDRGGSSISLSVDTQSFSISNSGMTLIKQENKGQYDAIEKAILNTTFVKINEQKKTVSIDLDTSITNYENNVILYVNNKKVYAKDRNGDYFTIELDLLPMNNKFEIYFMLDGNNSYQTVDKRFDDILEVLPSNNKIILSLEEDILTIK